MTTVHTVAVGFDGSPDAARAVRWAAGLARQVGAELVVVHAVGLLEHAAGHGAAARIEGDMHRITDEEGLAADRVRWHLADGDPCSVLLRAGEPPIAADLLVVGSRGRGAHAGLLLGSTSLELAEHATVPLAIVPVGRP